MAELLIKTGFGGGTAATGSYEKSTTGLGKRGAKCEKNLGHAGNFLRVGKLKVECAAPR
jgi:hypothetical protein